MKMAMELGVGSRTPRGVRGLKYSGLGYDNVIPLRRTPRGVREIVRMVKKELKQKVAPLAGCVD